MTCDFVAITGLAENDRTACFRLSRTSGCNTTRPCRVGELDATVDACEETYDVIVVLDQAQAHRELLAGSLACWRCSAPLRSWGYARRRSLRLSCGARVWLRPRRARCRSCTATDVLLPAFAPVRSAYTIDVVGQALVSSAQGRSHRTIAADLGLPDDTVRGWIRKVSGRAEWLRTTATAAAHMFDAMFDPPPPTAAGSPLAEAISALGGAATAARRMFGPIATPWELLAVIAQGHLLAPLRSD